MNDLRGTRARVSLSVGLVFFLAGASQGQDFPARPVKMVLATAPGSNSDLIARAFIPKMSENLGQPVVLDYRVGGGNIIGFEYAAKQVPDGYSILLLTVSQLALMPATVKDLKFDALRDLPPFIGLVEGRAFLVANAKLSARSFQEMVEYAKANPGKLSYASAGASLRLPIEAIKEKFGLDILHVPYSKSPEGYLAIATGEVQMGMVTEGSVVAFGDRIKVLALSGAQRAAKYPSIPTFAEVGFPLLQGFTYSLNAPRGTPQPVLNKLASAASGALKHPEVTSQLRKLDLDILDQPADEAIKNLADLARFFGELAPKVGIKPQ